ncbi:hypothetical protein niasHT_032807 [Heterodera trifolii]|uniref:Uncharacterized protein n=1 Tax=Heterodera trifolii TaxID=157864 RepID=A0ABD2IHA9_9BILA
MPTELNAEIVAALPFDIRWANVRISFAFDHFLYKKQAQWIRNELIRQKIVEENRQRLGQAKRRIEAMSFRLLPIHLRNLRDNIAFYFRLDNGFGLTENQFRGELTPEIFGIQLDAIFLTIDRDNFQDVSWAQKFIQSLANFCEGYVDEYMSANQ